MPKNSPFEVVAILASLSIVMAGASFVVRWDEARLAKRGDRERLARAWPPTSRDNAVIGLTLLVGPIVGVLAVVFHFFRTRSRSLLLPWRWSPVGLLLGLGWAAAIVAVDYAVIVLLALAWGIPLD